MKQIVRTPLIRLEAVVAVLVFASTSQLKAGFIETFSNPPSTEGWFAQGNSESNPGVNGNPDGYLQSQNSIAAFPWVAPALGASGSNFQGDIWTKNGSSLNFGFDVAIGSTGTVAHNMRVIFYQANAWPNRWEYYWTGVELDESDGWVHLGVALDKSWSDETYLANGWAKVGNPASFVDVLSNMGESWDIQAQPGNFTPGPTNVAGFDNIGWTAASPPAHPGDFDSDGDVDGADFVAWQTHFPTATDATLADGDADGDGDVDGADFVVWQTNFPFTPGPGASSIPEPGSICLVTLGIAIVLIASRHRVP